ncbi:hypothetical protein VE03_09799 [Pseudogymnoascus sp. 23342-1-I1]|nr:hypothetical protein VE03_09799 [Pseudogymnoascus sp. 23342-1-I1]
MPSVDKAKTPKSNEANIHSDNILYPSRPNHSGPVTRSHSRSCGEPSPAGNNDIASDRPTPGPPADSNFSVSTVSSCGTTSSTFSNTSGVNRRREESPSTPPSEYGDDEKGLEAPRCAVDVGEAPIAPLSRGVFKGEISRGSGHSPTDLRPSTPEFAQQNGEPGSGGFMSAIQDGSPMAYKQIRKHFETLAVAGKARKAAEEAERDVEDQRCSDMSKAFKTLGLDSGSSVAESERGLEEIDVTIHIHEPHDTDGAVTSDVSYGVRLEQQLEQQLQEPFNIAESSPSLGEDGVSSVINTKTEAASSQSSHNGEAAGQDKSTQPINPVPHSTIKSRGGPIRDAILKIIMKGPKPNHELGHVYIYTSPDILDCVKIGETKNTPKERIKRWGNCKITTEHVHDPGYVPFKHYKLVERLIEAELFNERCKYTCGICKKKSVSPPQNGKKPEMMNHGEWYKIIEGDAVAKVRRWREWFVLCEPYDDDGRLKPEWSARLESISKMSGEDVNEWVSALTRPLEITDTTPDSVSRILKSTPAAQKSIQGSCSSVNINCNIYNIIPNTTMDDEHSNLQAFILHLLERAKLGVPFLFFVPLFFPTYYKRSWINTGPAVSFFGLGVFVYVWKPWLNSRA